MMDFANTYIKFPKQPIAFHAATDTLPWSVPVLCRSYGWPTSLAGGGVIGIVELGGGYLASDVALFCSRLKLPHPNITNVSVDSGATNSPGLSDADGEIALDIQVALASYAVATGNKPATIKMYWCTNNLGGIQRGIARAAADGCDVCSISWGQFESGWPRAAALALEAAATAAAAGGMITFAASGDNASDDGDPTGTPDIDLPAGCPHIIGCGGSMRPRNSNQQTNPERVWGSGQANGEGGGGGISQYFHIPSWQVGKVLAAPNAVGRCVPDISANADPNTGYHIILQGSDIVVGGTSAVAPLFAGLFGAFGKKLGFIGETLWANPGIWRNPIPGSNGYTQPPVPGLATGLGTPYGSKLAALFVKS